MTTLKHHLAAERCEWNTIQPHSHLWRTCTLLSEIEARLNSIPLYALSDNSFNPTYLSLGHSLIGEPLTQLPAINKTNVNFNRLSGGKRTNNRYSSSGSANQQITSKLSFVKATCWDTGLSTTRPLCALSSDSLNPTFNYWHILIGKPLPN